MTGIETILALAGTVVSAVGSIAAGQAEANAAKFNAKAAEQQAKSERDSAAVEATDYKRDEMRKVASARTARLATGVTMAGSPLLVDEATVREVALGAQRIRFGGSIKSNRLMQQAELDRMGGKAAQTASYFQAGSSLLSGVSGWAGKYA